MKKKYTYHFVAYNRLTKERIGDFFWENITPKEYNKKLMAIYGAKTMYQLEHIISINNLKK